MRRPRSRLQDTSAKRTPERRSGQRRAVATGARVVTGLVVAAGAAAVAIGALVLPLPSVTATPASFTIDPAPAEEVRACPGPVVRLSDDTGQSATAISTVGSADYTSAVGLPDAALVQEALESPNATNWTPATAPQRITLPAEAATADALFSAAQSQTVGEGDLVGFASTSCGEATADSWLVAGATTVGRTSFVHLINSGDVSAVVDLSVFGEQGAVESPGARNIDVPARSTRILSLSGLAPDLTSPVIHVVARVGAVTAAVQQSVVRGLEPGGVELAGSTTAPATRQEISGVQVSGTSSIAERLGSPDAADLQSVLRLFTPGSEPASVTVTVSEERNGGAQTQYQLGLTPQIVTEFPLQDIPDGTYLVDVQSDQPVVASARTSTIANGVTDFAWFQASQPLDTTFFVSAAQGPNPRLHLINDTGSDVQVTLTATDGTQLPVTFVPGARSIGLEAGKSYTVVTSAPVSGAVSYFGDGQISSYAVSPPSPAAGPVVVYP